MSQLEDRIWRCLHGVYDPEIPVNIVDLGLVYEVTEYPINNILIRMTVTAPHCPAAVFLPEQVKEAAQHEKGVNDVYVELVYDPPWTKDRMTQNARKIFGYK